MVSSTSAACSALSGVPIVPPPRVLAAYGDDRLFEGPVANTLNTSQVRVGYLIDGRRGTPFQAASLTYEAGQGPLLTIPYILGSPQFAETEKWFVNRTDLPESLLFWDGDGMVTLLGLRWGGHSFAQAAVGRVVPQTVIFGRPRQLKSAYT